MVKPTRWEIILGNNIFLHMDVIPQREHSVIFDAIEQQLSYEATTQTRNRKPIYIPNTVGSTWELRCGKNNRYRIFYDVDVEARIVIVVAIGYKIGNRLFVGQEEIFL